MKRALAPSILAATLLAGCTVGPNYQRPAPAAPLPHDWHWQAAQPRDDLPKGPWWKLFRDDQLNRLEEAAMAQNQDLKAAVARVEESRARARLQGAAFFPSITAAPSYTRTQLPRDNPQFAKIPIPGILQRYEPYNSFNVPLDLSWELDLWGRVRRSFEAAQAEAQASVADYQNVLLTLQSDVAVEYYTLREYDSELAILTDTVTARTESLRINKVRVQAGRATNVDVAQASTDLTNAQASLADVAQRRAETQDALAVLCGVNPGDQVLASNPLAADVPPPVVPVGLPASVLERRPDIAEAERTMAAANAQIGVAVAAYYPDITITASLNFASTVLANLISFSNAVWSFGPQLAGTAIDGGSRAAQVESARANYDKTVATYRQTVLTAFQQVEDALAQQRILEQQEEAQRTAAGAAREAEQLAMNQYRAGTVPYTTVIQTQTVALSAELTLLSVRLSRLTASATLVTALGGGWRDVELPPPVPIAGPRRLHIGGKTAAPSWEILNAIAAPGVDHLGNANDLSRFADATFDTIYASHVVEHFDYQRELAKTLAEWQRVLKPGGSLLVSVPDLEVLATLLLDKSLAPVERFMVMRMMFGGHMDDYDYHYVGLTEEFLRDFLTGAGFVGIQKVESFGHFKDTSDLQFRGRRISLNVRATKPSAR